MTMDHRVGVVIFRLRPSKREADASVAYMRPIQNKHAALTIPIIRTPSGPRELNIWTFKGAAPSDPPTGMRQSVLIPSIYSVGPPSLSFTRVEQESHEATATFDMSSLMGLQHIFDMHSDTDITNGETDEDRLVVTAIYILALRTAVDYFEKAAATMPEVHEKMSGVMHDHSNALRLAGINVEEIDQFVRGCGVMANTFCVTAFKVNPQYMSDARRQLAMSGLAAILRTHVKSDDDIYFGVDIVDESSRELRMLAAYSQFSSALTDVIQKDTISMAIQECLLCNKHTISKTLRLHAIQIDSDTSCRICKTRIPHMKVACGQCHLCPHMGDIVCEECLEDGTCSVCDDHSTAVDFQRVAIESVSRTIIVMRENNKLRAHVTAAKTKVADAQAIEKKLKAVEKEVARLTLDNSDMRTQAKRDRRSDKRGSKDIRGATDTASCSPAEFEKMRAERDRLATANKALTAANAELSARCETLADTKPTLVDALEVARQYSDVQEVVAELQTKSGAFVDLLARTSARR